MNTKEIELFISSHEASRDIFQAYSASTLATKPRLLV
jgi:hypothetical protein